MEKLEKTDAKVEMVGDGKVNMKYQQHIINFGSLGREIKISPKSNVCLNKSGYKQEFFVESVSCTISIGKDHVADLIMSKAAFDAIRAGEEINVTTSKEFKEKFL